MLHDLTKPLPFQDNHADRIASIHVLEHFYLWEAKALLKEFLRVLKPGGEVVLELPCLDKVFGHMFHRMKKGESPHPSFSYFAIWGDPRFMDPLMCHRWGYGLQDMHSMLKEAGFVNVSTDQECNYHFPGRDMRAVAYKPKVEVQNATE